MSNQNSAVFSWKTVEVYAKHLARQVSFLIRESPTLAKSTLVPKLYGVPRGGVYAAQAVQLQLRESGQYSELVTDPSEAHFLIDDIIDSGATQCFYANYPIPFLALVNKLADKHHAQLGWVTFPWEQMNNETGPEESVRRIIEYIGDDPNREGLKDTPSRVVRSYSELFGGYGSDVKSALKTFEDGTCDEMVVVKDIEFTSFCEHHMLPFTGKAHVGYVPNGRIVGLSKVARVVDMFARRLQVQERLTSQIAEALMGEPLSPVGVGCMIEASHSCMSCRGVRKQTAVTITSDLRGVFREHAVRAEFLSLIRGN